MSTPKRPNQSLVPLAVFGVFAVLCMGWWVLYRFGPRPAIEEPALTSTVSPPTPPPPSASASASAR